MAWIPPKTWSVEDVPGVGDFNRIEGNIAALESGEVIPKGVLIRAVPSDKVILEANTLRSMSVSERDARESSSHSVLVKEFALKYPGTYRVKCEARQESGSGVGSVVVGVSSGVGVAASLSTRNWELKNLEITISIYGDVVRVYLRVINGTGTVYIRNVKICGTLTTAEPEYAVLLD